MAKKKAPPTPRQINQSAMGTIDQRAAALDKLQEDIDAKRANFSLKASDEKSLNELEEQVKAAQKTLADEKALRQSLEDAYAKSTVKNPEADPDVIAARKALQAHAKESGKQLYANQNAVANPCASCINNKLKRIKDCDTPFWTNTQYGSGPTYPVCNKHTLANYDGWDQLVQDDQKTQSERNAISVMSENEGDLDSVQGWDDQVASLGAMQKTINPKGEGELPEQVFEFMESDPDAYKRLFEDQGWSVRQDEIPAKVKKDKKGNVLPLDPPTYSKPRLYYKDPNDPDAKELTGLALKNYINQPNNAARWKQVLGPLHEAGQDPAFQRKQVCDFNARLVGAMMEQPSGYKGRTINEYLTSEKGAAFVLDQSVNRPAWVKEDFGAALNQFYAVNPKESKDPSKWTETQRAANEKKILEKYSAIRRLNDKDKRTKTINNSGLSGDPGTLTWPSKPGCGS